MEDTSMMKVTVKERDYSKDLVITNYLAIKAEAHEIAYIEGIRLPTWDEITKNKEILKKLEGKHIWVTSGVGSEPFTLDVRSGGNYGAGIDARLWPYAEAMVVGFRLGTKDLKRG
ncbi:MAG: hypothetical protein ABSD68_02875 [Candidatus Micrarchaeales archaeon]|jgi:hypothetical protein